VAASAAAAAAATPAAIKAMIILGPHVLVHCLPEEDDEQHHCCDRDGNDDGDDDAVVGDCSTSNSASAESKKSSNDDENNNDNAENNSKDDEADAAEQLLLYHHSLREPKQIMEDDDAARAWRDARLNVSMALGPIGAPPLIDPSSIDDTIPAKSIRGESYDVRKGGNDHDYANEPNGYINTTQKRAATTASLRANLYVLSEMASAHMELLQTVHCILVETLSVGVGVRLGLGPIISSSSSNGGNGRLVARAEKEWVARKQQQSPSKLPRANRYASAVNSRRPRLALQKVRTILHRALVEHTQQSTGLYGRVAPVEDGH